MRVRYSFSSRHTGRARDSPKMLKQRQKYPDALQKVIEQSHIILEILDSRFVKETRNKELENEIISKNKQIIYVINKADLNPNLENLPTPNVIVSCKKRRGIQNLRRMIKIFSSRAIQEDEKLKNKEGKVMVGIVGYPNTGKSSLINLLIGRNSAKTGADAGFTKGIQKLRLDDNITLLDSAGVIPKKEYSSVNSKLMSKNTKVGARSYSQVKDPEQVISDLMIEFPGAFEEHYRIDSKGDSEILLETLGRQKHFLKQKGEVDTDKTARLVLKNWQEGLIKFQKKIEDYL